MNTVAQFVEVTHQRAPRGEKLPERFIGTKEASLIADALDWHKMAQLAESARAYLPAVLAEIASLRATLARDPERMTIRALLFGIATPNRDEVQSIGWALGVERDFHTLSAHDLARQTYVSLVTGKRVAIGFYTSLTATIDAIKRGRVWEHVTLDALEAIRGIGPKVARMITAVLNPDARVFTVDLWHCRQLLWAAGREYCVRTGAKCKKSYAVLESLWLEYAERFFPDVPTWAVQWATWCAADGRFVSHASLWRD
jgi:hypothetical protein